MDCPADFVVRPDSHRNGHWTITGKFQQFSPKKIKFQTSVCSGVWPDNVGDCKDLSRHKTLQLTTRGGEEQKIPQKQVIAKNDLEKIK